MLEERRLVKISRYFAKHLRHRPERIGLTLDARGWVAVDLLLEACNEYGFSVTRAELDEVVARSDKSRYEVDAEDRIRAVHGHTVSVDLGLEPLVPPSTLFHGTAGGNLPATESAGLLKMDRNHVHLSEDAQTARRVGSRHGRTVVLEVSAVGMHESGHEFFRTTNGVWLVETVPPRYLRRVATRQ